MTVYWNDIVYVVNKQSFTNEYITMTTMTHIQNSLNNVIEYYKKNQKEVKNG